MLYGGYKMCDIVCKGALPPRHYVAGHRSVNLVNCFFNDEPEYERDLIIPKLATVVDVASFLRV